MKNLLAITVAVSLVSSQFVFAQGPQVKPTPTPSPTPQVQEFSQTESDELADDAADLIAQAAAAAAAKKQEPVQYKEDHDDTVSIPADGIAVVPVDGSNFDDSIPDSEDDFAGVVGGGSTTATAVKAVESRKQVGPAIVFVPKESLSVTFMKEYTKTSESYKMSGFTGAGPPTG